MIYQGKIRQNNIEVNDEYVQVINEPTEYKFYDTKPGI